MMRCVRFQHILQVCIVALFLFLTGVAVPCRAQQRAMDSPPSTSQLTPFVAYEFGRPLTLERTPGEWTWCSQCDGEGKSYNHLFRFGTSFSLPGFPSQTVQTNARLSLSIADGKFLSNTYTVFFYDQATFQTIQEERQFTVRALAATLGLDVLLRWNVDEHWSLNAGPWIDYRILSHFLHTEETLSINEVRTLATRTVGEGEILGSSPFGAGLMLGASYTIPLSHTLAVTPELYTRMNGEAVIDGLGIRAFSAGAGIILQKVVPKEQSIPLPPSLPEFAPVPPPIPTRPELTASINLYCVDEKGTEQEEGILFPRTTRIRRHTPPTEDHSIQDFNAPQIGLSPAITAHAGLRWWRLSVRQGEKEIAYVTSADPEKAIDIALHVEKGEQPLPLTAELLVEDSTGAMTGARDSLKFAFASFGDNATAESYVTEEDWWILPEIEHGENRLTRQQKEIIGEAANFFQSARKKESHVEMILFATPENLKGEEIETIAKELRAQGIQPLLSNNQPTITSTAPDARDNKIYVLVRSTSRLHTEQ